MLLIRLNWDFPQAGGRSSFITMDVSSPKERSSFVLGEGGAPLERAIFQQKMENATGGYGHPLDSVTTAFDLWSGLSTKEFFVYGPIIESGAELTLQPFEDLPEGANF